MKIALAMEYEQSIREKQQLKQQNDLNTAEMDRKQQDIGVKLALEDDQMLSNKNYTSNTPKIYNIGSSKYLEFSKVME